MQCVLVDAHTGLNENGNGWCLLASGQRCERSTAAGSNLCDMFSDCLYQDDSICCGQQMEVGTVVVESSHISDVDDRKNQEAGITQWMKRKGSQVWYTCLSNPSTVETGADRTG